MPNIREYSAGTDLAIRPDDRAMESTANAGRRISALHSTAAEATMDLGRRTASTVQTIGDQVVKYAENREISKGAADSATTMAKLDQLWNERVKNADPNDPTVAAKFREEVVEPTLQAMRDGPITEGGQRFAEATSQRFRNHFFEKTASDMSRLAGVAARQNIETLTNQLSNAALNDPTSLKTSLDLVQHSVGAMVDSSPTISGVDAARMKLELTAAAQKEIVKAAAVGAISANPAEGLKKFSSPEYSKYISGADLKSLEQRAKEVQRADRVEQNYQRVMAERAKEEASDQREGEYLKRLYSDNPKEAATVSAREIANDFTLTRQARERMIGIVERATEPEAPAKVSAATANDLIRRIRAPQGDPTRIDNLNPVYDAYQKGQLNKADLKFVRDEFANLRTPDGLALATQQEEFIKSVKPFITDANPLLDKLDPGGSQKVYEFTVALRRKIEEYRKAGKDPRDLMDPSKPESYMGSPAALDPYKKTLSQSMTDTAAAIRRGSAAPARNDAMPAIPPVGQRDVGGIYETPRGKMKWTGTGWVAP